MGKFIKATETFKLNDASTHVPYSVQDRKTGEKLLAIKTSTEQHVPYVPKVHNDSRQPSGIKEGYTLVAMTYAQYNYTSSKNHLRVTAKREARASRIPTQEEIAIISSKNTDAYLAMCFDVAQGDANEKFDKKGLNRETTKILVLKDKIYGGAYQPYIPSKHGNNIPTKAITVGNYQKARSTARRVYEDWLSKNSTTNSTTTTTTTSQEREAVDAMIDSVTMMPAITPATVKTTQNFQPIITLKNYERMDHQSHHNNLETNNIEEEQTSTEDETDTDINVSSILTSFKATKRKFSDYQESPSTTTTSSNLFQSGGRNPVQPSHDNEPTDLEQQIKRWRPWED